MSWLPFFKIYLYFNRIQLFRNILIAGNMCVPVKMYIKHSNMSYVKRVFFFFWWLCLSDGDRGPRKLMRAGLTLILVGHINFILGAIVHGSVLRHISNPSYRISTEYTIDNIFSVTSGLLVSRVLSVLAMQSRTLVNFKVWQILVWFSFCVCV